MPVPDFMNISASQPCETADDNGSNPTDTFI
jgi:hypothetical protein